MPPPTVYGRKEQSMKTLTIMRFAGTALAVTLVLTLLPKAAAADENCCLNNFRFAGGCMVVAHGSETCASIQSYLNSFDSVGKYYCGNTTVRGGWTLSDCSSPAQTQAQPLTPQQSQPTERIQQSQPSIRSSQPQNAPAASDANLMQVSAPLQVQFDSSLDPATQSAGQTVTGTLQNDLMDGDTVIAPAGSQVQAQIVPTSYWGDGSGDAFQIQATAIQVGDNVIPINGKSVQAEGSMVSFETATADQSETHKPTLSASGSTWMEAFNSHDAEGLAALYTQDAVFLPPNAPAVFGRDAIRATHQEFFATGDLKIDIEALETVIDGQLAYVAGRYRLWTDDATLVDRGKYIEIWRAIDGQWLIHRDIYNSSLPLPVTPETGN